MNNIRPNSTGSLVITIKPAAIKTFFMAATLVFYIIHKSKLGNVFRTYFFGVYLCHFPQMLNPWRFSTRTRTDKIYLFCWFLVFGFSHGVRGEFPDDVSGATVGPETSSENSPCTPCKKHKTKNQYSLHGDSLKSRYIYFTLLISHIGCATQSWERKTNRHSPTLLRVSAYLSSKFTVDRHRDIASREIYIDVSDVRIVGVTTEDGHCCFCDTGWP